MQTCSGVVSMLGAAQRSREIHSSPRADGETGEVRLERRKKVRCAIDARLRSDAPLAMKNPDTVFASPEAVEDALQLTAAQKRAILTQWKDQLRQLLIADEESMLRADPKPGANAECLRRVSDSMRRLSY